MSSVINGTNIVLYYFNPSTSTGVPFGAATSCSLSMSNDQVEITTSESDGFRQYKTGQTEWDVTCDGFIALSENYNYAYLSQLMLNKGTITIKFSIDNDNGSGSGLLGYTIYTGQANITNISLTGPVEGASTYSVTLRGSGGLSIDGVDVTQESINISSQIVKMYDYTASGGETSVTFSGAIGFTCFSVSRGGVEVQDINPVTVDANDVTFNTVTGILTFGSALVAGEHIRALFK